jgi:hypothetical protein
MIPTDPRANAKYALLASELRAIELGTVLMLVFLISAIVIGQWRWRRMSKAQARIYLRSFLAGWLESDCRLMHRKRARKAVRANARSGEKSVVAERPWSDPKAYADPRESYSPKE